MILTVEHYVPSLRWRMAEYQALLRLEPSVKDRVVPLICLPDIEFDFESGQPKKTVHDYILPFPKRFQNKWGNCSAWVTLSQKVAAGRMDDGTHVLDYIFDQLRSSKAHAIPAIPLTADSDTVAAVNRAVAQDRLGLGIILRLEDLMINGSMRKVAALTAPTGVRLNETDLIIDLHAPNFEPYAVFANAMICTVQRFGDLRAFRNFILISTAIPKKFAAVAKGTDQIPRHDWLFYNALRDAWPMEMRHPVYGDYTIVHPDFVARNMRMMRPPGKVVYTAAANWGTRKGGAFRGNEAQMHEHCQRIVGDPVFAFQGPAFSFGDDYIDKCAKGLVGPSNLTRWKEVGINHHITMVANDLAKLAVSS